MGLSSAQEQENKQVVRRFFELLDRHDTESMGRLLVSSTNYSFHIGGMSSPVDWNEYRRLLTGVNNSFPDLRHEVIDMMAEGDKVAVRIRVTGTHKGDFQGIPPTGNKLFLEEMGFITIIDAKITEGWISTDTMRLMKQIGAVPSISPDNRGIPADS
jgi:steroid delta-isomerase-like uncharacterized protein